MAKWISNRSRALGVMIVLVAFAAIMASSGDASAVAVDDLPDALANALGTTAYVAKLIISVAFIFAVLLPLSMTKIKAGPMSIMLIVIMLPLTAVGYLESWVIMVSMILVAALFALGVMKLA
jgi:hypothetical protein